jgi:hypothetical protein
VFSVRIDYDKYDKLVVSGRFRRKHYEEFELTSSSDFYVKVLRGRARVKVRVRKHEGWKEYVVTPLSDRVVLKVEEITSTCGWEECEEVKKVMIYEYTQSDGWRKTSEYVKEEW